MNRDELFYLHDSLTSKARDILVTKNHDYSYGDDPFANFRDSQVLGVKPEIGILIRCLDKFKRLRTFLAAGELKVENESVEDAILDVINYMVLLAGLLAERRETAPVEYASSLTGKDVATTIENIKSYMAAQNRPAMTDMSEGIINFLLKQLTSE